MIPSNQNTTNTPVTTKAAFKYQLIMLIIIMLVIFALYHAFSKQILSFLAPLNAAITYLIMSIFVMICWPLLITLLKFSEYLLQKDVLVKGIKTQAKKRVSKKMSHRLTQFLTKFMKYKFYKLLVFHKLVANAQNVIKVLMRLFKRLLQALTYTDFRIVTFLNILGIADIVTPLLKNHTLFLPNSTYLGIIFYIMPVAAIVFSLFSITPQPHDSDKFFYRCMLINFYPVLLFITFNKTVHLTTEFSLFITAYALLLLLMSMHILAEFIAKHFNS